MVSFGEIKADARIRSYITAADKSLEIIGFTEHGLRHASLTADIAHSILTQLKRSRQECELALIAGYLHDIGNIVNREGHAQSSAILAHGILHELGMPTDDLITVTAAIGNHHEEHSDPVNVIAAAVIIGDKADVHRSRVRNPRMISFDIHDRVNYAAIKSFVDVNAKKKTITLELQIDTKISQVMEYFEIFLERMIACRRAAEFLKCRFGLVINGTKLL